MTLTQEQLKEVLDYNPETGVFTWKVDRGGKAKAGTIAGSITPKNYVSIRVNNVAWLAHRLAFFYVYNYLPEFIDHKDNNPLNNSINNLRETNKSQNQSNRRKNCNNTSGYKGVSWSKDLKKWVAQCNGKWLGSFKTKEEAASRYNEAAIELQGEFATLNKV